MGFHKRQSERYELKCSIDILLDRERVAFGTLIDISRDGLGFKSQQRLSFGEPYSVQIRGIGIYPCKIVTASLGRHGAVFLIDEKRKSQLESLIKAALD